MVLVWPDEEATRAYAARLAARPAIGNAFIELHGDLGAGKTTFVRHLLRAMGVRERIKSPTYTVMEPHDIGAPGGETEQAVGPQGSGRFLNSKGTVTSAISSGTSQTSFAGSPVWPFQSSRAKTMLRSRLLEAPAVVVP